MYTVSQAARMVGVSSGALRMWETQGLISPTRDGAGRRVYGDDDVERIRKIAWWRRVRGLNAPAIRRILDEEDYAGLGAPPAPASEQPAVSLRSQRKKAGLTLRELSQRSGLSVSFLSAVERGVSSPSPTASTRITAALQDAGSVDAQEDPRIHRIGSGKRVDVAPGITYEWLSASSGLMEPQVVTVQPGARSEATYSHAGEEFLLVLRGRLELTLNGAVQVLERRDSVHFDSHLDHAWGNPAEEEAEVLWVTTERGVWSGGRGDHDTAGTAPVDGEDG